MVSAVVALLEAIVGALFFLERWTGQRDYWVALWYCGACTACALMIRPSNIVLLPAAQRIRARVAEAFETQELMMEGVLCVFDGAHPAVIRQRLDCFQRVTGETHDS